MNLGLLKGWATGGPAGLTPAPAGAATPIPSAVEVGADPAFRMLMDLFAVPAPVFPLGDSDAMVRIESPIVAWPSALTRVTVRDREVLPIAPALDPADEDEQAVDELLAGLFACTDSIPLDRTVARPDLPAVALPLSPVRDEDTEPPVAASTPFVRPAPVAMPRETSFESSQPARIGKTVRAAEHAAAAAGADADSSAVVTGAMATADAPLSDDREQSGSEPFKNDARKQAAMPVPAVGQRFDFDRNAAVPEFATPTARPAVNSPFGAQPPARTPLKAPAPSITFTPSFIHAVQANAAGRMLAAASTQETHAPSSLPGTTAAQIVQTIQIAWFRHGGEARITLDPEQFGDLSVAMRVDRGVVVARVQADASPVREWLQANQDTLRTSLAEHHLRLDRLEIAATDEARESENREAGQRDGQEPSSHPRRSRRHRPDQLFEIDA